MHTIEVGCAIIVKAGKILIAQRKPGTHLGGYWEFPGGKRHDGELLEDCLIREVREELGIEIHPRKLLGRTQHVYPEKKIVLDFYFCDWITGRPVKHDCFDFRWVEPLELRSYRFPPADTDVINELIRKRTHYFRPETIDYRR